MTTEPSRRKRRVPEVVQTSNLDCGPASLSALLTGLCIPANYEVLRELCATDVDGTSIDTMEWVAAQVGTDAEQMVVPAEHVLALPSEYLPAIVVTELADGFTHFVVVWSKHGNRFQVMDPAQGRRWLSGRQLLAELYCHEVTVPALAWRDWAGSAVFTSGLDARLRRLRVSDVSRRELIEKAVGDQGLDGLRLLDAAIRRSERTAAPLSTTDVPAAEHFSCLRVDTRGDGDIHTDTDTDTDTEQVQLRGAVIVRVRNLTEVIDQDLRARLAEPAARTGRVLAGAIARPRLAVLGVAVCAVLSSLAYLGEIVFLEPFFAHGSGSESPPGPATAAIITAVLLSLLSLSLCRFMGRSVEATLRTRVAGAVAALPDIWTRTRPSSDLVERGHLLHKVRELPGQFYQLIFGVTTIVVSAALLIAQDSAVAIYVVLLTVSAIIGPLLAVRAAAERDLRVRALSGCLTRYVEDALLGAEAIRAGAGAASVRYEHERTLHHWYVAGRSLVTVASCARAAVDIATIALGCAVVVTIADNGAVGWTALSGLLVLQLIDGGTQLTDLLRSAPVVRSVLTRIASWLSAGHVLPEPLQLHGSGFTLDNVNVQFGAVPVLSGVSMTIPAGAHVAVVGPSGGGKTTLLGVLLGTIAPTSGVISRPPQAPIAWAAGETRLWNKSLADNVVYGTDPSDLDQRLRAAELTEVAQRLSGMGDPAQGGLPLGECGRLLSDGQAQRVRIARALGRADAPLVVLDEPFQGLERDRRRRMLQTVRRHWSGSTLICATHDVDDTEDFDLVIVVRDGSVAALGRPVDLLRTESAYRALLTAHQRETFGSGWQRIQIGETTEVDA